MSADVAKLLRAALKLPDGERAELAAQLIESLDEGFDEDAESAWSAEVARRLAEVRSGSAKLIPWSIARRQIMGAADAGSGA